MTDHSAPLPRAEVIKAVERRGPARVPMVRSLWWGEGLSEQYGDRLLELEERYPEDVKQIWLENPCYMHLDRLSWNWQTGAGHDSTVIIQDWSQLDEFIEKMVMPEDYDWSFQESQAAWARANDRYILSGWWRLFFECPWSLRGMENLLCDFHEEPEQVHRLHDAICTLYERWMAALVEHVRPDGFWSSDDLGHQTQPMMSPAIFHDLHRPYYDRIGAACRKYGLHFWLHSCGNNTPLLPDRIGAGLNVFHPVQKHCMIEEEVARKYGDQITWLAGIDVQHTLQEKGPEGIREEVRFLIDTFDRPEGGMCLAAGNGIVGGTPFENIEAFLDEARRYGAAHRQAVMAH
jgi:uroporphyrinogen decarboxylase